MGYMWGFYLYLCYKSPVKLTPYFLKTKLQRNDFYYYKYESAKFIIIIHEIWYNTGWGMIVIVIAKCYYTVRYTA